VATPQNIAELRKCAKAKRRERSAAEKKLKQHCTRYILYFQRLKTHSKASAERKRSAKVPASRKFCNICSHLCITAAKSAGKILQEPKKNEKILHIVVGGGDVSGGSDARSSAGSGGDAAAKGSS